MNQKKGGDLQRGNERQGSAVEGGVGQYVQWILSRSARFLAHPVEPVCLSLLSGGPGSGAGVVVGVDSVEGGVVQPGGGEEREQQGKGIILPVAIATTHGTWHGRSAISQGGSAGEAGDQPSRPCCSQKRAGGALFHQEAPPEWMRRGGRKGATVPRLDARPQARQVAGCRASKACQGSSQECQGPSGPDGGAGLTGTAKHAQEATDWSLPGPWIPGVGRPTRLFSAGRLLGSSGRLAGSGWPAWDRSWGGAFALSRVLDFHGSTQILAVGCWKRHANLPPLNA